MIRIPAIFALIVCLLGTTLRSDTPTATVSGLVQDSSGGLIQGASVVIRNVEDGSQRTTSTNGSGLYSIPGLSAGRFEVLVQASNFTQSRRDGIVLRVAETVRIDFTLVLGPSREIVEVRETAPLAQTDSSKVYTVINRQAIADLPSDGRQLQNLALLAPGVDAGWNLSTAANRYGKARENTEGAFSLNGARSRSNNFLFDGLPTNLRQYDVINFEPSNEAVEEFAVLSSIPPAQYGRTMGGTINIVTRRGTDAYHGSGYEFFRNNVLNANGTLNNRAGLPRGTVRHHQFGGTLGGPIWKNKHFFFLNAELLRNLEGSETRTSHVPTAQESQGLISYLDPAGRPATLDLRDRITPVSARLLALYPSPNANSAAGNYTAPLQISLNDYQYNLRTDHYFTGRDVVTPRTSWNLNDQTYIIDRFGGPYIPGFPLPNPERTTNGTIGYLHTFSSSTVNEVRLGVNRYGNFLANGDNRDAAAFGLPNGSDANGIPTISFAQGGLAGLGGLAFYNREQNELTVFLSDTVSLLKGSHNVKFGGSGTRYHFNTRGASNSRGTLSFDGSRNTLIPKSTANSQANALADLLLGLPYRATITVGQFGRGYRQWAWAGFVQDSWRATRRLTLDYGLRYEYNPPWTEVNQKLSNFLPGQGLVTPASTGWNGLYQADRTNFGPRLGFALDLDGRGRTVLRGGFGWLYETILQASTVQQIENNPPFSGSAFTTSPTPFARTDQPSTTLLDLRQSVRPATSIAAIPLHLRSPYSLQYSLDVQRALGSAWLIEVGYRATRGVHLPYDYNIDRVPIETLSSAQRGSLASALASGIAPAPLVDPLRPFPGYQSIDLFDNSAVSSFHSLQTRVERRFQAGLNLLAAYTWSKSIDDATDFASDDPSEHVLNSRNRQLQRAVSSFDVPHRFTAAFNYQLPVPVWKSFLGGWQVNGIVTVQSGQPFTPYSSVFDPFRNESFNRLTIVSDPNRDVPPDHAYNPAAFAQVPAGTFGTSGRNIIRGDGYRSADLSLFRTFNLTESSHLQLRGEAQNSFNQVNFQGPITNQATTPGLFVATAPPRTVQLGAKLTF